MTHQIQKKQLPLRAGRWLIVGLLLLLLAACGAGDQQASDTPTADAVAATEAPTTAPPAPPTETPTPEAEAAAPTDIPPTDTPIEEDINEDIDTADLVTALEATIPIRPEGGTDGFDGINVFAADGIDGQALWVAHSYGIRVFMPDEIPHFVAIYESADGAWNEIARIELECADYVDEAGVNQVTIAPESLWFTVDGGAGAHSGCFDLLRWDGATFVDLIQGFNSSPGAGDVTDLDGDGQNEVVLNATDPYIFCYACGVRLYAAQVLRWDGAQLTPVTLTELGEDAAADVREANNRAVALANADLYNQALPLIEETATLAPEDAVVHWNAQLIRLYAENRLAYVDGGYPILSYVFYGDYAAAVDLMRDLTPVEIFSAESPLIMGTPAEGWIPEMSQYLVSFADRAIAADPELAHAYFLRAWGRYLSDPGDPAIETDLAQAATLTPEDALLQAADEEITVP
ncbi:MAG: hypothetical protein R2856_16390 [Caldilineaceae bacterium]